MSLSHFVFLWKKFASPVVPSVFLITASEVFKSFVIPNPASSNFKSMDIFF